MPCFKAVLIDQGMSHGHAHAVFNSIGYDLSFHGGFFNYDLSPELTRDNPLPSVLRANALAVVQLGNDDPNTATRIWVDF